MTVAQDEATTHRNVTKWIAALALFLVFLGFLAMLQVFQATTEATSERTLRRALAVVSEVDVLLDRHYDDLRQRADSVGANETLELQDFPVSVPLTTEEVRTQSRDELRATLLERGADILYDDGTGAMRAESSEGDVAVFSFGGSFDRTLNLLRADVHVATGVMMAVLGGIALFLALLLGLATRGFGRVVALGLVALASSATLLLLALLVRLSAVTDDGDEYVRSEFIDIAHEVTWLPIRNGVILVVVAAIVTALGVIGARVADSRHERAA
jgi:hypothetical protein